MLGGLAGLCASSIAARAAPGAEILPIPPSNTLAFRIRRKGDDIGKHLVSFREDGDKLRIAVAVDIVVYIGPIPVFRYKHRASETWQGGALIAADGKTDDDGTPHSMTARLGPQGLEVNGSDSGRYAAPPGALVANHWNWHELKGPMVNPQGGKLLRLVVTPYPQEQVALASGQLVPARRYHLAGDTPLDLWYDRADMWTAARFIAKDGSELRYERL